MAAMLANEEGNKIGEGNASDGREAALESNITTADMPHAIAKKQPAGTQTSAHDARAKADSAGKRPSEVTWHLSTRATPSFGISSDAPAAASAEAGVTTRRSGPGTCDASSQPLADGSVLEHQEQQELLPSVVTWRCPPVPRRAAAGAALKTIPDLTAASAGQQQGKEASMHGNESQRDSERETSSTTVLCPCAPVPRQRDRILPRPVLAPAPCARAQSVMLPGVVSGREPLPLHLLVWLCVCVHRSVRAGIYMQMKDGAWWMRRRPKRSKKERREQRRWKTSGPYKARSIKPRRW